MPTTRNGRPSGLTRRKLLAAAGAGAAAAGLAGCLGSRLAPANGDGDFRSQIDRMDFAGNGAERRSAAFDQWPLEARRAVPAGDDRFTAEGWIDSESVETAPWTPPPGWDETDAADVDRIAVLNYGDMRLDPATAAVDALFERATGIAVDRVEIPMDRAIARAEEFLSSGKSTPHLLQSTTSSSMTTYAAAGWLEPVDFLMPERSSWDAYLPLCRRTYNWDGRLWGAPANFEGVVMNVRVDLLEEQGLDAELERIRDGTWTWTELERTMEAFAGTDVYGYAFRGGSPTDAERDWRQLWYQAGGQYLDDDGRVAIDRAGVLALRKLIEWRDAGWLPPDADEWGEPELLDAFHSGRLALAPIATDAVADALARLEPETEYVIARLPKANEGPAPRHATYGGGPITAINRFAPTPQKVAGALFQDCRFSEAASWWEYVEEGNMSPARAVYSQAEARDAVFMSDVRARAMYDAKNEVFAQQGAIMRRTSREIRRAFAGRKPPEKAVQDAQEFIDRVLDQ